MYKELSAQLRADEGLRLQAYHCPAGKLTIGYGHNLEARPYYKGKPIPHIIAEDFAEELLQYDIEKTEKLLIELCPTYRHVSPARQDALLNMAFQMGVRGLLEFKRMFAALDAGNYEKAYIEAMESKWYRQTPGRANRVARQMLYGEYQK